MEVRIEGIAGKKGTKTFFLFENLWTEAGYGIKKTAANPL
jgi:hypothetical protein